jgi:hypothetical protein
MDQTGAFSMTLQQGYWYIMVGIHLDANYIFWESMKNKIKGNDHCLPKNFQQDKACGTQVKTSLVRQQVFCKIQAMHYKERDDSQVSPPRLPLLQHCQTGKPNVQKPFHLLPQLS